MRSGHRRFRGYIGPVAFLCAVFCLSGCRTLKAPPKPFEEWTPPKWEKTSRSHDAVWESIREQEIVSQEPLTLADIISVALANNPLTRQVWETARSRQYRIKQAESEWFPQVKAETDLTKQKKVAHPRTDNLNVRNYGAQARATYMVLDFGGRGAAVEEATQNLLAANFQYNQSIQDLLLSTETAYYEFISAGSSLEAAEADVRDTKTAFEAARQRFDVGLVSKLDVLQAESTYDDSLYVLEEAKGNVKITKGTLAQIMGLRADTPFEVASPPENVPAEMTKEDVTGLIDEALARRPDIAAERATLRAREAAVRIANSDLWPTFNVGGSTEKRWSDYYGDSKTYANYYDYSAYMKIQWDIFDGFSNLAKRNAVRAEAEAEREKLIQSELEASKDVWTKYYNFNTAIKKFKFSVAFLNSSEASYELASGGYKAGLKSILDVLEAQSKLSEARSRLIGSRKDLFVSLAQLIHSTGSLHVRGE
ncbi:MAG: TolC family protein [Candidatus Omnitrophota bacterium]|nr:TolC family protein [Candidatus Omnitrophota bacterium]